MTHWAEFFSRGILTLLSFSSFGTAIRCFIDNELVVNKLFQTQSKDNTFSHLFGVYSGLTCLIFSQSAIYLYVYPLTRLVYGCIISYLLLFLLEIYYYKTLILTSSLYFSLFINVATLIWISVFHIWKPYRMDSTDPEKETLLKYGLPIVKPINRKKKQTKFN